MEAVRKLTPVYDIKTAVKEIYNTDMEAVRQLAVMANKLNNASGLEIPGNLTVTGTIKSTGSITSTGNIESNGEIKTLNTDNTDKASLNTVNTNTTSNSSSISSLSSSLSSANTSISTLDGKIKEFDNEYIWGTNSAGGIYRCKAPCNGNWERIGTGALWPITQSKKYIWGTLRIEKAKLFLFATTTLKNKTTFYFLTVAMVVILIDVQNLVIQVPGNLYLED